MPVPKLLLLICDSSERATLDEKLAPYAEITWVCDLQQMSWQLEKANYDAQFCAHTLCQGSWREVVREAQRLNHNLPVIVLSQTDRDREWDEMIAAGAFDLLAAPYDEMELLALMEHAVSSHEARVRQGHERFDTAIAS